MNFCASDRGNLPESRLLNQSPAKSTGRSLRKLAMTNAPATRETACPPGIASLPHEDENARIVKQPEYYSRFGGSTSTVQPINGIPFSIVVGSGPRRMICQRKRPNNLRV